MVKLFARVISFAFNLSAYKIWKTQCKQNIFKFGVGVEKMSVCQRKTGHISETVRDSAKIAINH